MFVIEVEEKGRTRTGKRAEQKCQTKRTRLFIATGDMCVCRSEREGRASALFLVHARGECRDAFECCCVAGAANAVRMVSDGCTCTGCHLALRHE